MTRLAADALVMAERNLVRLPRAPDLAPPRAPQ